MRAGRGEWRLWDRGRLIGTIQVGRVDGRRVFRGVIRRDDREQVIGYSPTLEECCTEFWNWDVRFGRG
jgi:hypothetical protein